MLYVIGPKDKVDSDHIIMTVSRSTNWSKGLSPFVLGPCKLYGDFVSQNVENGWQFLKIHRSHVDENNEPTEEYWKWAKAGWEDRRAQRYPMGKGATPLYSLWNGEKLDYITARKRIYIPLYYEAVVNSSAFFLLNMEYESSEKDLYLWDFDGYNHKELGMSYDEVVNCKERKMGHAFVLAMILEGFDKYFKRS